MGNKVKTLYVAYATDDNYAKFCGISLISLLERNKGFDEINIYILDSDIGEDNKSKIADIANQYGRNICFIEVENLLYNLNLNMGSRKIAIASYARLFLSLIIPEKISKVLYLDCDIIVKGDLMELWNTDIADYCVAGVKDTVDKFFMEKIKLDRSECYINAGVLLINLDMWRSKNIHEEFFQVIEQFAGNVPHHDQGVINMVCKEKVIVAAKHNMTTNMYSFSSKTIRNMYFIDDYYSQVDLDEAKINPTIIHFTTGIYGRPWEKNCIHPMRNEYMKFAKISPWKDFQLLPDSRGHGVKIFGFSYNHFPGTLVETMYKSLSWALHFKE